MPEHYSIGAANRMVEAFEDDSLIAPLRIRNALRIGCHTLGLIARDLGNDGPLRRDLELLRRRKDEYRNDIVRATETLKYFTEMFRHFEEDALHKAGASRKLVRFLFADVENLLRAIRDQELSPDQAKNYIERLEHSVCSSRDSVVEMLLSRERRRRAKQLLKRGLLGVAGAGVVSINASGDAITNLGLLPWMTALSGSFGGVLVSQAFPGGDASE